MLILSWWNMLNVMNLTTLNSWRASGVNDPLRAVPKPKRYFSWGVGFARDSNSIRRERLTMRQHIKLSCVVVCLNTSLEARWAVLLQWRAGTNISVHEQYVYTMIRQKPITLFGLTQVPTTPGGGGSFCESHLDKLPNFHQSWFMSLLYCLFYAAKMDSTALWEIRKFKQDDI
jgi:hypothetical protein